MSNAIQSGRADQPIDFSAGERMKNFTYFPKPHSWGEINIKKGWADLQPTLEFWFGFLKQNSHIFDCCLTLKALGAWRLALHLHAHSFQGVLPGSSPRSLLSPSLVTLKKQKTRVPQKLWVYLDEGKRNFCGGVHHPLPMLLIRIALAWNRKWTGYWEKHIRNTHCCPQHALSRNFSIHNALFAKGAQLWIQEPAMNLHMRRKTHMRLAEFVTWEFSCSLNFVFKTCLKHMDSGQNDIWTYMFS